LLRAAWRSPHERRAFVRSPRPLGESGAWREIDLHAVFELRVDQGGAALLFATTSATPIPSWFTILRDTPGEPRRALSGRIVVEGALVDAAIEDREVSLWITTAPRFGRCVRWKDPDERDHATRFVLTEGGSPTRAPRR